MLDSQFEIYLLLKFVILISIIYLNYTLMSKYKCSCLIIWLILIPNNNIGIFKIKQMSRILA